LGTQISRLKSEAAWYPKNIHWLLGGRIWTCDIQVISLTFLAVCLKKNEKSPDILSYLNIHQTV